jgi:tape measure domain-containing protein
MANAASTIEIELEIRQAINRLDRLQRELTQSTQSFNKAAQATRKFEGAINKAKAGLVAFFAAISIQKLAQLSDAMTQFENRVKLATNSLVQQLAVQQQLFQVAQKTALPLEDVGQLYSRLRIAAEQLGASQRDLINLTETVGLALKASGTSAASAQGALLQLGQALNSPRVQAEEFNSLIDGMPNLLKEVEKQLGLTAGGLKKFVTDGQLSNKKFFDAILASQNALTQQANSSASTIEQANQRVANSFTSLIGAIDDKLGASKFFTGFIDGLASGIDKLSNFLGLTTQATGGGGGGGDLDEVIRGAAPSGSQYAFPTIGAERITESIGRFPNYVQEINSLKELKSLEEDLLFIREDQAKQIADAVNSNKETVDILGAQNVPLKEAQGYLDLENKLLDSIIQKRKIELQQNKENLTYLEQATNYLKEQFNLNDRTAGAIVSGISSAGPNASRAMNIANSKDPAEAALKLILSNEKVAAAIDKSFEILFDAIDPLLDILGDLLSAINRLIGALIQNATNAAEGLLDTVGLGPNGYIFGGGLARDLEDAFGFGPGSSKATGPTAMQKAFAEADKVFLAIEQEQSTLEKLQPKINELAALLDSLSLSDIIERFTEQTQKAIEPLQAEIEKYEFALTQTGPKGGGANYFADFYNQQIQTATDKIVEVNEKTSIVISGLISEFLSEPLATLDDLERSATDSIAAIEFQNLSAEEQIQFRYEEAIATIEQQKALADLVNDEELRTQLLDSANRATQAQNDLLAKQQEELQRLNEEREREAALLLQQQGQAQVDKLLSDLERTFDDIIELVQGLRDQASGLLLGQYSTASATDRFSTAADTYSDLLAAALDPEATEENVKDFQDFVDTYLKSAQDVFKSSSRYQNIFDSVLADIEEVAEFVQATMPQSEIDKVREQLTDVAEEFGLGVEEVINGLDRLVLALTFRALVVDVPVQTVIDEGNSDLIVEAVITAVEDQQLSDTEIISIVTAVADKLSDTQIEAIVTAVAASNSDTNIEAVVSATASNTPIIQAVVDAIAANIPVIQAQIDVDINTDSISLAVENLGSTLQSAVTALVIDMNQSAAAVEGETLSTLAALGQGGNVVTSGLYKSDNPTVYYYDGNAGVTTYADSSLSDRENRNLSVSDLAATYLASGLIERNYYVFTDYGNQTEISGFDELEDAKRYSFGRLSSGFDVQKIGFRRGGLVDPMDTIPAMLSPGEYILSPETVRRYGVSNLNRLNSGDTAALNATSDPEVKRLLAELIVAVKENDTEVNVYTDMEGQTKASIEEFRSELRERTRRQGDKFLPARYI